MTPSLLPTGLSMGRSAERGAGIPSYQERCMEIMRIEDIARYAGRDVTIQGWVYNRTDKGKLCFLLVRDGTGFAQCVHRLASGIP